MKTQYAYSSAKAAYLASSSLAGGYNVFKEFPHSAVGLTVSVGRNDYKGYKLFCNGFFHEWHYLSHPRASAARPGDLWIFGLSPTMTEREESHPRACPGDLKTQGTCSRYARRKHRASAKVLAAAGVAVKLATACALQQRFVPQPASAQGRSLVKLATACKPAWQTKYSPLKNI